MHVATTTRRYRDKTYRTHLLRRTFREGGKVKHETLGNISHLPDPIIELIRRALKGETLVNPDSAFDCVRSLPHGHVAAVLGSVKQLGLPTLIARQATRLRDLVVALVVARVIDARSTLATARALAPESAVSTLGEVLGLGDVDQHELHAAMDWLVERQAGIEQRLARRHLQEHTLVAAARIREDLHGVDRKVRPPRHRPADRMRAHVLLRMLACYVEWHMRRALAPVLFDDDVPVHSFRTLLTDLGTLTANTMQVAGGGATFTLQTRPTPLQQRCFELLEVTPRM